MMKCLILLINTALSRCWPSTARPFVYFEMLVHDIQKSQGPYPWAPHETRVIVMTPTKRPPTKHILGDSRSRASRTGMVAMDDDQYNTSAKAQEVAVAAKKAEQLFLKVSIDVALYLRKVDLRMYEGYRYYSGGRVEPCIGQFP
ncbi:auxin-induced protein AUX28-like isoform X2 [Lolium rigidum]|uniref:auxin-induced protein AUX28-like isoform X2 n=1 Tax=Lolium rigidum TaxID=89674 RepID=UPI001F5C38A4|nr:auxin-induced protein AUX28-like isoform X2 [Lolium rigidum]